jgi:hypothetical protein
MSIDVQEAHGSASVRNPLLSQCASEICGTTDGGQAAEFTP